MQTSNPPASAATAPAAKSLLLCSTHTLDVPASLWLIAALPVRAALHCLYAKTSFRDARQSLHEIAYALGADQQPAA